MEACPRCQQVLPLDRLRLPQLVASSRWRYCDSCGYPLYTADLLERIWTQKGQISEVITMTDYKSTVLHERLDATNALEGLKRQENMTFPEYEDEDLVVLRVVGDILIFNFGQLGAFNRFLRVFQGEEDKETGVTGQGENASDNRKRD